MLVLSRKKGETIVVGDPPVVTFTIVDIRGDKVRIGVKADPKIPVHREEIYEVIKHGYNRPKPEGDENESAASEG